MLNASCYFEQPPGFGIIHLISTSLSIPIYFSAIWILLFKSPSHFNNYRNYLVSHIFSGILLEFHMGTIWKVTVVLPIPIMCSNSFAAEYAPIVFQFLPICIIYTGLSALSLFIYRMEAAVVHHSQQYWLRKVVYYSKYAFYLTLVFLVILTILIYPELKYQIDYKRKMEARFGKFESYMWCDNCFFLNFDSKTFMAFYIVCGIGVVFCFTSGICSLIVTIRFLNDINGHLSDKSKRLQKNFLYSLVITMCVHIICIMLPLFVFIFAISIIVTINEFPYFLYILVLIIQEHGAASTVAMFLTNNLLRQTIKKILQVPGSNNIPKDPTSVISHLSTSFR